jgi:enolase
LRADGIIATGIADEGGSDLPITMPKEVLELLETAVASCGYTGKIKYAIDPAASELFVGAGSYDLGFKDTTQNALSQLQVQNLYRRLLEEYPIVLLEDPFAEDDWESWKDFNKTCLVELVGDDLPMTNVRRVELAQAKKACNSMLLKVNQIGTVTEAIAA